jgi:hypothetical protein
MRISSRSFSRFGAIGLALFMAGTQTAAAQADDTTVAKAKKPPSACVGLDQGACAGMSACYWRKATILKTGKSRRAHCRIRRSAAKTPPA